MRLTGYAKDVTTVSAMDQGLRDETHQVIAKRRNESPSESGYEIQFRSSVQISPGDATTRAKRTSSGSNSPQSTVPAGEES